MRTGRMGRKLGYTYRKVLSRIAGLIASSVPLPLAFNPPNEKFQLLFREGNGFLDGGVPSFCSYPPLLHLLLLQKELLLLHQVSSKELNELG
ncbi:hypothetical protein TNCT_549791 [Trichonephila clavata]|uniref:Uncharacterized protein n=1 Tax=Trichonephila clavata TaxID=2740835 RepID=A0A8X6HGH0_TRICU|nr:hypothetical protein TNCT_549791 [Trichonephila clavata]